MNISMFLSQFVNDEMLKPNNEACFKCKYKPKEVIVSREKMLQREKAISFKICCSSYDTLKSTF